MSLQTDAEEFLAQKRIAVVGVSRGGGTGNGILQRLRTTGYTVFAVNPQATEIDGVTCYPTVQAIPDGVDGAIIVTRPEVAMAVVQDCDVAGVKRIWMHNNAFFGAANSSVSDEAVEYCREHGMMVIPGACPLMYGPTADFGHKCMRWLLGATGRLPETA